MPKKDPPPGEELENSPWRSVTVTLTLDDSSKRKVAGVAYGKVGVWPSVGPQKWGAGYAVSTLTTGDVLTVVATEADARRIGQYLWGKCCLALRCQSREEILDNLLSWVRPWCLAMRRARKWLAPEPFKERERR